MKQTIKTGPKRRRWRRRDWSGKGGYGQVRRWGSTVGNFRRERLAALIKVEDREARDG
jgi:hypothetical protein